MEVHIALEVLGRMWQRREERQALGGNHSPEVVRLVLESHSSICHGTYIALPKEGEEVIHHSRNRHKVHI